MIFENKNWALSAGQRSISLYSNYDLKNTKNPLLIIGGVHGDEPEGVWLSEALLVWLKTHNPEKPWLLIPCINPDGYEKNSRINANGVDLNRNFKDKNWSPLSEQARYHPGPAPLSEPETQALTQLIETQKPKIIIHCHSWHPCIVYTGEPAKEMATVLSESSGYKLSPTIGYSTPGSLGEYGWHEMQIPVICIEEQEGAKKETVWPRFQKAFEKIFFGKAL